MKDLGDGRMGIVLGAHAVEGRLQPIPFQEADYQATKEHYNPKKYTSWWRPDFDTEVDTVESDLSDTDLIKNILRSSANYQENEKREPIPYPTTTQQGRLPNSNSWAQSIVKHSGGKKFKNDFMGIDASRTKKVDARYFQNPPAPITVESVQRYRDEVRAGSLDPDSIILGVDPPLTPEEDEDREEAESVDPPK